MLSASARWRRRGARRALTPFTYQDLRYRLIGPFRASRTGSGVGIVDARSPDARKPLMALRGNGEPGDQDVLYGSITAVPAERETIVGLQQKFLYMLTLLQGADVEPTPQHSRPSRNCRRHWQR